MIMSQGFENKNIYAEKPTKDVTKKASANVKVNWAEEILKTEIEEKKEFTHNIPPSARCHGKPPVPFQRPSSLSKEEQQSYLRLCEKFKKPMLQKLNQTQKQEINQFKELQQRVVAEQEECQAFLENTATALAEDYEYMHPDAAKYMEDWLAERRQLVRSYARYYVQHDSVPLAPPPVPRELHLKHTQRLLHMGKIAKATVPRTLANQVLSMKYNIVSRRYPVQLPKQDSEIWNKQVVSEDSNCNKLAVGHKIDTVISGSTLRCLLECVPGSPRQWELPVVVRMETDENGEQHKVVYIDKPFIPKTMSAREKNSIYYKFALKTTWIHPDHQGAVQIGAPGRDDNTDTGRETSDGGSGVPVSRGGDIFSCDSAPEIDDLETFGLSNLKKKVTAVKRKNSDQTEAPDTEKTAGKKTKEISDPVVVPSKPNVMTTVVNKLPVVQSVTLQTSTCTSDSEEEKLIIDCHDSAQTVSDYTAISLPHSSDTVVGSAASSMDEDPASYSIQQTDGPGDLVKRKRGRPPKNRGGANNVASAIASKASSPIPGRVTRRSQKFVQDVPIEESSKNDGAEAGPPMCVQQQPEDEEEKHVSPVKEEVSVDVKDSEQATVKLEAGDTLGTVSTAESDVKMQAEVTVCDSLNNETNIDIKKESGNNTLVGRKRRARQHSLQRSSAAPISPPGMSLPSSSNKNDPLGHILHGQEKLSQMGKKPRFSGERGDAGSTINMQAFSPPYDTGTAGHQTICDNDVEWQPSEDVTKFLPPTEKRNLMYDTWSLGSQKLLIRSSIHGISKQKKKQARNVVMTSKLEYQPYYGYEQLTHGEAAAAWTHLTLHQDCQLIRFRLNAFNQNIMAVEKIDHRSPMPRTSFIPLAALNILHQILSKLQSLSVGQYLLSHAVGGTHATIKKTTTSKKGVYDLHLAYSNYNQPTSQSASKWIPVDPTMALPDYIVRHRIPLTFEPRSGANQKPWQNRKKPQSKKKKKRGKSAKQANQN